MLKKMVKTKLECHTDFSNYEQILYFRNFYFGIQ